MGTRKRKNQKHSYSEEMQVVELYNRGCGSTSISKELQISVTVVKTWLRIYQSQGLTGLNKQPNKLFSIEFKEFVVRDVLNNCLSFESVALKHGISQSAAYQWVQQVKQEGFNSLKDTKQGRPAKIMGRPKKKQPETELEKLEEELRYLRAENAYLKKVRALVQERLLRESGKQQAIEELRLKHELSHLLKASSMARATFYYHLQRQQVPDKHLGVRKQINDIFKANMGRYGYRRITLELHNRSIAINHETVERLMREDGIKCQVRLKKYRSYRGLEGKIAPNLLNRDFTATTPNSKWVTDITEFALFGKKRYLSPILDLYNGEIISYTVSERPNLLMVTNMLIQATKNIKSDIDLVLHSDQGWHYQHATYQNNLKKKGIRQSMSRKGNCLDNAVMENFFGLLKSELLYLQKFSCIEHFESQLKSYIYYYNNHRIKAKLKGLSPVKFRTQSY